MRRLGPIALVATLSLGAAGVLAQAEAERQLDAAIARLRAALGPGGEITIGSRQVDPVTGRVRLNDVVLTGQGRRLSAAELVLQDLTAERLGRGEARDVRLEEGKSEVTEAARLVIGGFPIPPEGTPFTPADIQFDAFELENVRSSRPGQGSFTLGRVVARDYQRAFAGTPGTLGSGLIEGFRLESTVASTPDMRIGRFAAANLAFPDFRAGSPDARVFRAGELTVEGVAVRDTAKNVDFELPRLALRDWLPGRQTRLAVEGVNLATDFGQLGPGRLRVGRIAASGIDAASTVAAVMDGIQPPDPPVGVPQTMAIEGIEMQAGGQPLFSLGRIAADGRLDAAGLAIGSMVMEGFRAAVPRGSAPPLEGMGFRDVAGALEIRGEAQRDAGQLRIAPFRLTWEGAGVLTLETRMTNFPTVAPGAKADPMELMGRYAASEIAAATLRYQDQGLLGRFIAQQARQQRIPEARLREQWAQMALTMPIPGAPGGQAKGQPQAADPFASMRQAAAAFIRQPGTLEVAMRPPQPVALAAFAGLGAAGPAGAVRTLGLDIRVP
jgi:hypothetical protein